MATGKPTLTAAQRAADALAEAGVGRVLLVGSVARGEQEEDSDIDLVAIYDDLDYEERWARRSDLVRRARQASGCVIDLLVTDAAEWAVRTTKVPCSTEAALRPGAIELVQSASHGEIDWNKEIGLPASPTHELSMRYTDMCNAVTRLAEALRVGADERDDIDMLNHARFQRSEDLRFGMGCAHAHLVLESGSKALIICTVGQPPPRVHDIAQLVGLLPANEQAVWQRLTAGADIDLHLWREGSSYVLDRPIPGFDEPYMRIIARVAADIAAHVTDTCEAAGVDAPLIQQGRDECRRLRDALGSEIRIEDDHPIRHT